MKVLLKGVSGAFRPGVLTALTGVSGVGKTTLMDVLAVGKLVDILRGASKFLVIQRSMKLLLEFQDFVSKMTSTLHISSMNPYSTQLGFVYPLKSILEPERQGSIAEGSLKFNGSLCTLNIITLVLGFYGVSYHLGSSNLFCLAENASEDDFNILKESSKRLTIAVELVANPSIVFMDKPTSGLDARAAAIVMRIVRNTVDTGRTIVSTIHQPSIDIFEAFDELFLMKRGGEEIYVGSLGRYSSHLIKYFEKIEGVSKITYGYNPATWMLEVTNSAQELSLGVDFAAYYGIQNFTACLWKQRVLLAKSTIYCRNILFTTFIALMLGTMFWDLGSKMSKEQDIFNSAAVLFLGVQNASSVQPVVAVERPSSIEKELQECIQLCLMHMRRSWLSFHTFLHK
ncbi:hypothetical protein GH714_041734 [Hevea brasiliensis]|uniref:AAA+ ATPase domain-containing protein n=1 Tax=Hevea brasiliensis TaxID=3981 RepID=A0A6A6MW21_HEVBR|nr:hypothetical protein GH714_041734 [Hevea brasiliensis]